MKLWVDDIRNPKGFVEDPDNWVWAKTVTEAIRILDPLNSANPFTIEEVSLDHDISHDVKIEGVSRPFPATETFEPVARFLVQVITNINAAEFETRFPNGFPVTIHTANDVGMLRLVTILANKPRFKVTIKKGKPCNRWEVEDG